MIKRFHDRVSAVLLSRGVSANFRTLKDIEFDPYLTFVCSLSSHNAGTLQSQMQSLISVFPRRFSNFALRVYADDSLLKTKEWKNLLPEIMDCKFISVVRFSFPQFTEPGSTRHKGFFGTVVKLIPVFNFDASSSASNSASSSANGPVVIVDIVSVNMETQARFVSKVLSDSMGPDSASRYRLVLAAHSNYAILTSEDLSGRVTDLNFFKNDMNLRFSASSLYCTKRLDPIYMTSWMEWAVRSQDPRAFKQGSDEHFLAYLCNYMDPSTRLRTGLMVRPSSMLLYNEYVFSNMFRQNALTSQFIKNMYSYVLADECSGDVNEDFGTVDTRLRLHVSPDHVFNRRVYEFLNAAVKTGVLRKNMRGSESVIRFHEIFMNLITRFDYAEYFYKNVQVISLDSVGARGTTPRRSLVLRKMSKTNTKTITIKNSNRALVDVQ